MQVDEAGLWRESKRQGRRLLMVVVVVKARVENLATRFNFIVTTARNIQIVVIVALALVAGVGWLATSYLELPSWLLGLMIGVLGFVVGVIAATIVIRFVGRNQTANGGFVVTDYQMVYTVDPVDHRKHTCARTMKLKATRNNARFFTFNYNWSGHGDVQSRVDSPGHRILGDVGQAEPGRCLVIYVGAHDRGDEVELRVTQELMDTTGHFGHFISKVIKLGMESIKLTIALPRAIDFDPQMVATIVGTNSESSWVRKRVLTPEISRSGYTWTIEKKKPRPVGGQVVLKWGWEGTY